MSEEMIKNLIARLNHNCSNACLNDASSCICTVNDIKDLIHLYSKEKEKNIEDMIKDVECSNFIKNNYIHKNEIEALLQDVDNTKFINKHVKGMYLYDNLKCLLEE